MNAALNPGAPKMVSAATVNGMPMYLMLGARCPSSLLKNGSFILAITYIR